MSDSDSQLGNELQVILDTLEQTSVSLLNMPRRIELCQRALQLISRDHHPEVWAALQVSLGNSLAQSSVVDQATNMERAIKAYKAALTIFKYKTLSIQWAQTMVNLANAYRDRIAGNRSANLELAIKTYEAAQIILIHERFPVLWAIMMLNLGITYDVRVVGNRLDNVKQAISSYDAALTVLTREQLPIEWATTMHNLATAYQDHIADNRLDNLERAIKMYQEALTVRTKERLPLEWAQTMNNLANAYSKRILGEQKENLEQAIEAYEEALTVRTKERLPLEWAQTMMNLGAAYSKRIAGERRENLEQAIAITKAGLEILTRRQLPIEWARMMENLGAAYYERIAGDPRTNIEQAIEAYEEALTVRTKERLPLEWAQTMMNLGAAYSKRITGERRENLERSIEAYEEALTVRTKERLPLEWAATMMNLGIAYGDRIAGERGENLERSIAAYEAALTVWTKEQSPIEWAMTMMNLGVAYRHRIAGERRENLERSIAAYEAALMVQTPERLPLEWAMTMMNLGIAYRNRIIGGQEENLERAIKAFEAALIVRTREQLPIEWAETTVNLGNAYGNRIAGEREKNLGRAIAAYEAALTVLTREQSPIDWAALMMNLGNAYRERSVNNKADNVERAIAAYEAALTVMTRDQMPFEHRETQRNLGLLFFRNQDWLKAHRAFEAALTVGADLLEAAYTEIGRRSEIADTSQLYVDAAYCLLQMGQCDAALVRLEAGKTRLLAEALAYEAADQKALTPEQTDQLTILRHHIHDLEAEYRLSPDTPARRHDRELATMLEAARHGLRDLIAAIRADHPDFLPRGLDLAKILALIPEQGALVAPLFTLQGSAIFVVPHGVTTVAEDYILWLDHFTTEDLDRLLIGTEKAPGWLHYYVAHRFGGQTLARWKQAIDGVTEQLWNVLMGLVYERLTSLGIQQVLVMPQGGTGLLPLHAAWRMVEGERRYFLDDFELRYVPSAYAQRTAAQRLHNAHGHRALVAGVGDYGGHDDLPNVPHEVSVIAKLLGIEPLLDAEVTCAAVIAGAAQANYIHLACHGSFAWGDNPLVSSLALTPPERLSLGQILSEVDLARARLVTLSTCETGIIDLRRSPDEFIGLPTGFLQAGAAGVVSSLWMVNDTSTTLLMQRFYDNHLGEKRMEPVTALHEAQQWLRTITWDEIPSISRMEKSEYEVAINAVLGQVIQNPFDHPYYWAAFTFTGA